MSETRVFICVECGHAFEAEPPLFAPHRSCGVNGCGGLAEQQGEPLVITGLRALYPHTEAGR